MAEMGNTTYVAGKFFRAPFPLRRRYVLIILAATLIKWTGVYLRRRFSCSCCHAGKAGAVTRWGFDSSYLPHNSVEAERRTSSPLLYGASTCFNRLLSNSAAVFVTATADVNASTSAPSVLEPLQSSPASIQVGLFQAISRFFASKKADSRNLAKEVDKDSMSGETHRTDCSGGVSVDHLPNPEEGCGLAHSGNFYGRMLQAVSDLIPPRLFDEAGDAEDVGFLSRRRPKKVSWVVPGDVGETTETAAGRDDIGQEVESPSATPHADAPGAAVEAASDGAFNIFPPIGGYTLGGALNPYKSKPRRTPLWPLSAFPTSEGRLFHTSTTNEASLSRNNPTEEQKDGQQQQEHQRETNGFVNETISKQTQQQLTQESFATPEFRQTIAEAPVGRPVPAKELTARQQVDTEKQSNAVDITLHPLKQQALRPLTKDTKSMKNPPNNEKVVGKRSISQDKTNRTTSSNDNSSRSISSSTRTENSIYKSLKGNKRDSHHSTGITKSATSSTGNIKNDSSTKGGERRSVGGRSKPHRRFSTSTNKRSESFDETKGSEEVEPLMLQELFTPDVDDSYLNGGDPLSQPGSNSGLLTPRVHLSNVSSKKSTGIPNKVTTSALASVDPPGVVDNTHQGVTRNSKKNSGKSTRGVGSHRPIGSANTQIVNSRTSAKESSNTEKNYRHQSAAPNEESERSSSSTGSAPAPVTGSKSFLSALLSTPLHLLSKSSAEQPSPQASYAGSFTHKKPRYSADRSSHSRKRKKSEPVMTLDTLRETGSLGSTFAQAVDISGALIEVISASKDLQKAIEDLDFSAFGLPAVMSGGSSKKSGFEKLHSAARAVEEVAHWSAAMDHAINTSKHFGESVSNTLQNLHMPTPSMSSTLVSKLEGEQRDRDTPFKGLNFLKDRSREISLAREAKAGFLGSRFDMKQLIPRGDWKDTATIAFEETAQRAKDVQKVLLAALENSDSIILNSKRELKSDPLPQHALNANDILIAIAGLNASERSRSLKHQQQAGEQQEDEEEGEQQNPRRGRHSLLPQAANVKEQIGALFQVNTHQEGSSDGEYMMPLLRELYRAARHVFEVLDVSISIADESMDAMQLGKLLRIYEALVEEGKLAAVGFRSPQVPKRLGLPKVSCANKGMTCCIPAASAGPDWKQKQQQQFFLQNSPQQECKAVFVSRSSMLCASTPYRNSPCNITHTETAAMDKYSALLPVPAFSAAALCECEVSRRRNSDGLQKLDGKAEWTVGEIPADLVDKARKGWQYVKKLSSAGNSLVNLLDPTLGTAELSPTYDASVRQQEQRQEQVELVEKPFSGLADAVTKMLMNAQLIKLLKSDNAGAVVIPPISVSMHLPQKTSGFLLSKLQLPLFQPRPPTPISPTPKELEQNE